MTDTHYAHRRRPDQHQGLHYSHFLPQQARKCLNGGHLGGRPCSNPGANRRSRVKTIGGLRTLPLVELLKVRGWVTGTFAAYNSIPLADSGERWEPSPA
ncbi:MAG: hypothetical protein ACYCT1_10175 [Steroidobacteraceae bacterium]